MTPIILVSITSTEIKTHLVNINNDNEQDFEKIYRDSDEDSREL